MESFYGGRPGSSFVIVRRFDGIEVPLVNGEIPKRQKQYAIKEIIDDEPIYYYTRKNGQNILIEKTGSAYNEISNWYLTTLDGSEVNAKQYNIDSSAPTDIIQITLANEDQEGMIETFRRGSETTGLVNYGEYVIIDTPDKNNPDNGKIFRRGLDYDNDEGGAEYIGQVVGPQGGPADINLTSQDDEDLNDVIEKEQTPDNLSLVSGKTHSSIKYKYINIRDQYGLISKFKVGFEIPYLVQEFIATKISPYQQDGQPLPADYDLIEDITPEGSSSFYKKFEIKVPYGFKGDDVKNFRVYPKIAKLGTMIYSEGDIKCEGSSSELTEEDCFVSFVNIKEDIESLIDTLTISKKNNNDELIFVGYAKIDDPNLEELHLGYLQITKYDIDEEGFKEQIDLGIYKIIDDVNIDYDADYIDDDDTLGHDRFKISYSDATSSFVGKKISSIKEFAIENGSIVTETGTSKYSNLLVRYTDQGSNGTYSYNGKNDWCNLGNIVGDKGESGGIHIIRNYDIWNGQELPGDSTTPEMIKTGCEGQVITKTETQGMSPEILAYDYINHGWYSLGSIDSYSVDPKRIINTDYNYLNINGVQLVVTTRKHA